jgi:hypothetical protein
LISLRGVCGVSLRLIGGVLIASRVSPLIGGALIGCALIAGSIRRRGGRVGPAASAVIADPRSTAGAHVDPKDGDPGMGADDGEAFAITAIAC